MMFSLQGCKADLQRSGCQEYFSDTLKAPRKAGAVSAAARFAGRFLIEGNAYKEMPPGQNVQSGILESILLGLRGLFGRLFSGLSALILLRHKTAPPFSESRSASPRAGALSSTLSENIL